MIPFIFIVIGSVVAVIAAFFDYKQKIADQQEELYKERQRNCEYQNIISKSNDIIANNNEIIKGQVKVIDTTHKIAELQAENLEKSKELSQQYHKNAELQKELNNYVTGGETKPTVLIQCYKRPFNQIGEGYQINVDIENKGKYPLQNVVCTVNDVSCVATQKYVRQFRSLGGWIGDREALKAGETPEVEFNSNIGTLAPGSRFPIFTGVYKKLYSNMEPGFTVKVRWNNGDLAYYFHGKIINDKLFDDGTSEIVFNGKKIPSGNIEFL